MKRLLAVVLLVAGCGVTVTSPSPRPARTLGANPQTSTRSAAVPASPSADPEAIRKAAGAAHLAAVNRFNQTDKQLDAKYATRLHTEPRPDRETTRLRTRKIYCAELADNAHRWLAALRAIAFPTDTAADAKNLIRLGAAYEAQLRVCATSTLHDQWDKAIKLGSQVLEAANLIQLDLGLARIPA